MKKFVLFLSVLLFNLVESQTLTQTYNEPDPGDIEINFPLDTSGFTAGLPAGTGTNVTWDFTALQANLPSLINSYTGTTSVANATNYPGCTFVMSGMYDAYYKSVTSPTTQTELIGLNSSTLTLNLSNTAIVAKYPMSFGSNITDNIAGTFTAFGYSGTCSGKITTDADGKGTLKLPASTLSNVLRITSVQTLTLSNIIPLLTAKQKITTYYHSSSKFAILTINYTTLTPISGSATTTSFLNGNTGFFVTGLDEIKESRLVIYPNPSQGILNMEVDAQLQPSKMRIYSIHGSMLFSGDFSKEVNLQAADKGVYYVDIITQKGNLRQLFILE